MTLTQITKDERLNPQT